MNQKTFNALMRSILLATVLYSSLIASACSAESLNITESVKQNDPTQTYELGLAYYEGDSVLEDDDKAFKLF